MNDFVKTKKKSVKKTIQRVQECQAYLLHSYPYKETSLIVELFCRDYGRIALVAKGAKRPHSSLRNVLLNFQSLSVDWSGAGEVKTLIRAELAGEPRRLQGSAMMSSWYLNELLLKLIPREDPHDDLMDYYDLALSQLALGLPPAQVLRAFEWALLRQMGYGFDPSVTNDNQAVLAHLYYKVPLQGAVELVTDDYLTSGMVSGKVLLALSEQAFDDTLVQTELRRLLRDRIDHHLQGRVLSTRQILRDLQNYD